LEMHGVQNFNVHAACTYYAYVILHMYNVYVQMYGFSDKIYIQKNINFD